MRNYVSKGFGKSYEWLGEIILSYMGFARKYMSLTKNVILSAAKDLKNPAYGYLSESDAPLFRFFVATLLRMTFVGQSLIHGGNGDPSPLIGIPGEVARPFALPGILTPLGASQPRSDTTRPLPHTPLSAIRGGRPYPSGGWPTASHG